MTETANKVTDSLRGKILDILDDGDFLWHDFSNPYRVGIKNVRRDDLEEYADEIIEEFVKLISQATKPGN